MKKLFTLFLISVFIPSATIFAQDEIYFDDGESEYDELMNEGPLDSEVTDADFKQFEETKEEKKADIKAKPEAEKKVVEKATPSKRGLASVMTSGMRMLKKNCAMHSEADDSSSKISELKPGRKLWVDVVNSGWVKVFRKDGVGFLSTDCF